MRLAAFAAGVAVGFAITAYGVTRTVRNGTLLRILVAQAVAAKTEVEQ